MDGNPPKGKAKTAPKQRVTKAEAQAKAEEVFPPGAPLTEAELMRRAKGAFSNLTGEQVTVGMRLVKFFARYRNVTPDDVARQWFADMLYRESHPDPGMADVRGSTTFAEDGRAIITAYRAHDFSTLVHEVGHVFRRNVAPDMLALMDEMYGVKGGKWTTGAEERFARDMERYLLDGLLPEGAEAAPFKAFRRFLLDVYPEGSKERAALEEDSKDNEYVRGLMRKILGNEMGHGEQDTDLDVDQYVAGRLKQGKVEEGERFAKEAQEAAENDVARAKTDFKPLLQRGAVQPSDERTSALAVDALVTSRGDKAKAVDLLVGKLPPDAQASGRTHIAAAVETVDTLRRSMAMAENIDALRAKFVGEGQPDADRRASMFDTVYRHHWRSNNIEGVASQTVSDDVLQAVLNSVGQQNRGQWSDVVADRMARMMERPDIKQVLQEIRDRDMASVLTIDQARRLADEAWEMGTTIAGVRNLPVELLMLKDTAASAVHNLSLVEDAYHRGEVPSSAVREAERLAVKAAGQYRQIATDAGRMLRLTQVDAQTRAGYIEATPDMSARGGQPDSTVVRFGKPVVARTMAAAPRRANLLREFPAELQQSRGPAPKEMANQTVRRMQALVDFAYGAIVDDGIGDIATFRAALRDVVGDHPSAMAMADDAWFIAVLQVDRDNPAAGARAARKTMDPVPPAGDGDAGDAPARPRGRTPRQPATDPSTRPSEATGEIPGLNVPPPPESAAKAPRAPRKPRTVPEVKETAHQRFLRVLNESAMRTARETDRLQTNPDKSIEIAWTDAEWDEYLRLREVRRWKPGHRGNEVELYDPSTPRDHYDILDSSATGRDAATINELLELNGRVLPHLQKWRTESLMERQMAITNSNLLSGMMTQVRNLSTNIANFAMGVAQVGVTEAARVPYRIARNNAIAKRVFGLSDVAETDAATGGDFKSFWEGAVSGFADGRHDLDMLLRTGIERDQAIGGIVPYGAYTETKLGKYKVASSAWRFGIMMTRAGDTIARTMSAYGFLNMKAHRIALAEHAKDVSVNVAARRKEIFRIMTDPTVPPKEVKPYLQAIQDARQQGARFTFQEDNAFADMVIRFREFVSIPMPFGAGDFKPLFWIGGRFVKTPINIAKQLMEFDPIYAMVKMANRNVSESERQAVFGKFIVANVVVAALAAMQKAGWIDIRTRTPKDEQELSKVEGRQDYSIKFQSGRVLNYKLLYPFNVMALAAAALTEERQEDNQFQQAAMRALAATIGRAELFMDMPVINTMNLLMDEVMDKGIKEGSVKLVANLAKPMIPFIGALGNIRRMVDPAWRDTVEPNDPGTTFFNQFKNQMPLISKSLPPKRSGTGVKYPQVGMHGNPWARWTAAVNPAAMNAPLEPRDLVPQYKPSTNEEVPNTPETRRYYAAIENEKIRLRYAPAKAQATIRIESGDETKTVMLSARDASAFYKHVGYSVLEALGDLIHSEWYRNLPSDKDRREEMKNAAQAARTKARDQFTEWVRAKYEKRYLKSN